MQCNALSSGMNMTGGMMGMKAGGGPNITRSIKMSTVIGNALSSQIKVGLNQSAMIQRALGSGTLMQLARYWCGERILGIYCLGY